MGVTSKLTKEIFTTLKHISIFHNQALIHNKDSVLLNLSEYQVNRFILK